MNWTPSLSDVETTTHTEFGDGCSISSVRGEERDWVARRLALVYHLRYGDHPLALLDSALVPAEVADDFDAIIEWLASLSAKRSEQYATAAWDDLPEY